jgi:hypothetical protein
MIDDLVSQRGLPAIGYTKRVPTGHPAKSRHAKSTGISKKKKMVLYDHRFGENLRYSKSAFFPTKGSTYRIL